jgi:hypothetical protein
LLGSNGSIRAETMRRAGEGTGRRFGAACSRADASGVAAVGTASRICDFGRSETERVNAGGVAAANGLGGMIGAGRAAAAAGGAVLVVVAGGRLTGAGRPTIGLGRANAPGGGARFLGISRPAAAFLKTNLY